MIAHSLPGHPNIPPSKPFLERLSNKIDLSFLIATYTVPTRVGFFNFGVLFGKPSAIPLKSPSQLVIPWANAAFW